MNTIFDFLEKECSKILDHFEEAPQQVKTIEECSELIHALCRFLSREPFATKQVQEEIADCLIMLLQMRIIFHKDSIDQIIREKIERTLKLADSS